MDERLEQLVSWLRYDIGMDAFDIAPASEDASFRRYFRVSTDQNSLIVMDAPPEKEDCHPYMEIAQALGSLGLNVPRVIEADTSRGLLLLTDLGNRQYLTALNEAREAKNDMGEAIIDRLYRDAIDALICLQCTDHENDTVLPQYDRTLLMAEMKLFRDWFLMQYLSLTMDLEHSGVLDRVFNFLAETALEQPKTWVHRDYHSRNLMVVANNNPGILDFQDAVTGPVSYDLVSLLRDCYIQWPAERVQTWVKEYFARASRCDFLSGVDEAQFMRWFDFMGVQRHLKAIGIFTRLNIRDNKPGYMDDIPRTLGYILDICGRYPELSELGDLLNSIIVPQMKKNAARNP